MSNTKINVRKIKGYDIKPPKKGAFQIPTDDDFPKLHTLSIFSGRRGSGKSVGVANLVKMGKQKGYIDKCWLVSPTYWSNKEIWDIADINGPDDQCGDKFKNKEEHECEVYEPIVGVLRMIIKKVDEERVAWENHLMMLKRYKQYKKDLKKPLEDCDPEDVADYDEFGFLDHNGPPKWKYDHEGPGRCAVIIDDCVGTDLMSKPSAGLLNFCIKHRHIGKGTGISIFMLVQTYACLGGVPRAIRENATHLFLYKLKDETQLEKIHKEIGCDLDLDKFDEIFAFATVDQYAFLSIDFTIKNDEEHKRFRKNFNEYLT